MTAMIEAVTAHRTAWLAFQDAADAEASRAEDRETEALMTLLSTEAVSLTDLRQLAEHLAWYCDDEEAEQAGAQAMAINSLLRLTAFIVARAKALLDAVDFDNYGTMVAGQMRGGNGGLISRDTIKAADELRKALAVPS